ncbi:hypothetical protein [Spirosoma aerolatum]|uniref:hypothetical protein n=1 Tax=Spirosoma aerolatum TaxID=1211326 RepID=UPI0009ACEB5F|nr:hypothetical protein [Spirosoma aerolatum]
MKKFVALLALSIVCLLFVRSKQVEPTTKYYFCFSREVPRLESPEKLKMVYTDIRTASGNEEKEMHDVIQKFGTFINKNCKPTNELCTSDLNRYYTLEQAQTRHKEILEEYGKTGKYDISRIDFKTFE